MDINISEEQIDKISVGQEVSIVANYDETKEYEGTITKINAIGDKNNSGTSYAAIASLDNDGMLKIGMSATCEIILERAENVVAVPLEAIQTSDDGKYVIVIKDNGTQENVTVETGISNDAYIEIKSGISAKTQVVMAESTSSSNSSSRGGFNFNGGGPSSSGRSGSGSSGMSFPGGGDMPSFPGGGMPNM